MSDGGSQKQLKWELIAGHSRAIAALPADEAVDAACSLPQFSGIGTTTCHKPELAAAPAASDMKQRPTCSQKMAGAGSFGNVFCVAHANLSTKMNGGMSCNRRYRQGGK